MSMRQKVFSIVALLLVAVTGAWADESSESFTTNSEAGSYTGEHFKISVDNVGDEDGFFLSGDSYARIEALNGEIITKVEFTQGCYSITALRSAVGTTTYEGEVATVSGVNATSLAVNAPDLLQIKAVKVYYTTAPATVDVTANEGAVAGEYWATYYNATQAFTADANTTVFKAALTGSQLTMTEVPDREIPAGKAVILKSTAASITLTPATTTATLDGNQLQGTATAITNPGNAYVLNKKAGVVGFYKLSSTGTIGANKAYLTYSGAGAREFFSIEGNVTGIDDVRSQMSDVRGEVYDLQGRQVANPTKGLYIVNGKKVFINK